MPSAGNYGINRKMSLKYVGKGHKKKLSHINGKSYNEVTIKKKTNCRKKYHCIE